MNSMWKIPQDQCRTCCVFNLRFSKKVWEDAGIALQSLMQTYFAQGSFQMQINLVSRDELLAARQHPDQYADLVVRVGGFSDYYVRLSERLQDEILARTEHEV
jgi:formate C-acetyltransferase